jgi:hypothetical protein
LLRRRYFALRNIEKSTNRISKTVAPSNFSLLNLYIPADCGSLCKIQNPSNFRGMLLPPKNPMLPGLLAFARLAAFASTEAAPRL